VLEADYPRQETPTPARWRFAWALFWVLVFVDAVGNFSTTVVSSGERTARILTQIEKRLPQQITLFVAAAFALVVVDRLLLRQIENTPRERLQDWQSDRVVLRFCLASLLATLAFLSSTLLNDFVSTPVASLMESLCLLLAVLMLFSRPLSTGPWGWNDLGLRAGPWLKWVLLGLSAAAIFNLAEPLLGDLLYPWVTYRSTPDALLVSTESNWPTAIIVLFRAVVAAPIVLELVYRGALFPALDSKLRSPFWAALVGALIYAEMTGSSLPAWPGQIALALLSTLLLYRTRSLIPSVAMLAVSNVYWWIHIVGKYVR
jgi:membrane protease YdiL (CAAX protease family)